MSNQKVTPDDMTKVLNEILQDYAIEVRNTVGECGKEISEMAVEQLRAVKFSKGYDNGKYSASWKYKEEKGFMNYPKYIIYNEKHYRLTHLLEYGHDVYNGTGRIDGAYVKGQPHIKDVEDWVIDNLPKRLEQDLGGK